MNRYAIIPLLALTALGFGKCSTIPTVSPQPGPQQAAVTDLTGQRESKAAAAVNAAEVANQSNPEGAPKDAVAGELQVAKANLPAPSEADRLEALERANATLQGDLDKAREMRDAALGAAKTLELQLADAKRAAEVEARENAAAIQRMKDGYESKITDLQNELDSWEKKIVTVVFTIGGGLICVLGALSAAGIMSTVMAAWPVVGIRMGGSVIALGVCMIAAGQAICWVLDHKWVLIIPAALAGGIIALYVANQHHARSDSTGSQPAFVPSTEHAP